MCNLQQLKNRRFHVQQPIFLFPLETPLRLSCNNVVWMERQFNACQTPRCMHLSIFNSFRVTRCLSQCVSPKIAIFSTFLFPLETPLGQSRYMLYGFKENSMLTNCLAACTHLSSTVYQLFEPQVQKIVTYRSPHFCFPCAVVQSVEYRTRNREVAGSIHTRFTASNLEQVANLLCAQANSASYPCRDGKWVVATATGWRPSVTDWGDGVSAPWVQWSVSAGSGWPHRPAAPLAHTNQLPLPRL